MIAPFVFEESTLFYTTDQPHGLPRNPFNALVVPRPIGWISSLSKGGVPNLAPYSFFNAVAYDPPQVMFSGTGQHREGGLKDSVQNIADTKEFVVNLATEDLRQQVSDSSTPAPRDVDEFDAVGLEKASSECVKVPRVAASPAHLECVLVDIIDLERGSGDDLNRMVIGKVVGIHIDDSVLNEGFVDMAKVRPLSRLGYLDYTVVNDVFAINRPDWPLNDRD